jgi:hypothetical protein
MYCPNCRAEYRPGFTRCGDCETALVPQLPPRPPEPAGWIPVFATTDSLLVSLAQASLEDARIPFLDNAHESGARLIVGDAFPLCRFLVPPDYEQDARAILDNLTPEEDPDATE